MKCENCIYNENIYQDGKVILNREPSTTIRCRLGFPIECREGKELHSPSRMMHEALMEGNDD